MKKIYIFNNNKENTYKSIFTILKEYLNYSIFIRNNGSIYKLIIYIYILKGKRKNILKI
jgi:hypothetical protein